jgi:hypothetical protein
LQKKPEHFSCPSPWRIFIDAGWAERESFWKDQIADLGYYEAALLDSIVEETVRLHKSRMQSLPYFQRAGMP